MQSRRPKWDINGLKNRDFKQGYLISNMTITYSLDVANTRLCGFTKLLGRWKGSIYKILWKEFIVFLTGYSLLSLTYRFILSEPQKRNFENVVLYFETFIDLIPLSFVLGFYVSLVIGRWWSQFDAIPWPDRLCYMISAYVHGADDRSRMIRRTLGRYLILLQAIAFQSVSPAVKRRFPTSQHFVSAGLMTKEERTIYEKLDAPYGKWWFPAQWFVALAMRAKKEGRIKDSILLDGLFRELLSYRSTCGTMLGYDWISVPLVYTQVVTLATYTYSVGLMVGRQYLDPSRGDEKHRVDFYIPILTLLQFFFYMGWLKVAEQIVNPYGEDDDDFELNWCLDRNAQIVYLLVDHFHAKHPKLQKDMYWDEMLPQLPQTKISAKNITNPMLGSAFHLEINPADAEFLPMDTLLEEDNEANTYSNDSVKQRFGTRCRPSFLMNILNSSFGQNIRRRSTLKTESSKDPQGHRNPSLSVKNEKCSLPKGSTPSQSRKSTLVRKSSSTQSSASSTSFHSNNINRHKNKMSDVLERKSSSLSNGSIPKCQTKDFDFVTDTEEGTEDVTASVYETIDQSMEDESLPPIPEETSRVVSAVNLESVLEPSFPKEKDNVQSLVAEASKVLEELNRVVNAQGHRKDCESKDYESCCSLASDDDSFDENETMIDEYVVQEESIDKDSFVLNMQRPGGNQNENRLPDDVW
ncbi:Bestrophin-3 like protein [Argiope bruennichi]|uniref:Bestrophin homolog n=1 Tax=Argiope bruennichi TaxID=94029 RepID=A0A8T0EAY5_ARGBR|nr:Bestrophin-3 like protein [Argiope bruennichi]